MVQLVMRRYEPVTGVKTRQPVIGAKTGQPITEVKTRQPVTEVKTRRLSVKCLRSHVNYHRKTEVLLSPKTDSVILTMRVMMKKVVYLPGIETEDILVDLHVPRPVSVIVHILCKALHENTIKLGLEVSMH